MTQLAVSCVKPAGGLFLLDTKSKQVDKVAPDDTTGVAILPGGDLVRVLRSEDALEVLDTKTWKQKRRIQLPRKRADYHDIRVQPSGLVTVVATEQTSVDLFTPDLDYVGSFSFAEGLKDPWHLNSALLYNNGLLMSVFGIFDKDEEWRNRINTTTCGKVAWLRDDGARFFALQGLAMPHSLVPHERGFAVCDSLPSALVIHDGANETTRFSVGRGFMRGLCRAANKWYFGLSSMRYRDHENGRVVEMDDDGNSLRNWVMPSPEIYDIEEVPA